MPSHISPPGQRAEIVEVERVRRRFERLLEAGLAVSSEHDLDRILQRVVDLARELIGATYAALGMLNDDGQGFTTFVTAGMSEAVRARIGEPPRGLGLLGLVIEQGRPLRAADIALHPARYGFPPNHPSMRSFLGVPIVGRRGAIGNLYFTDKLDAPEFTDEDQAIAVLFAAQAAVAVENARLYRETTQLLAQVQAMQRQRDQFFAMVNHELRNALTGVYGWAERLVRNKPPSAVPPAAREVFEAAERTIELLNNLLDLSRLDAGKVRPLWRSVAVPAAVRRARASYQPSADAKGLRIVERYPDPPPTCWTDEVRLEQILVNLLSNAVRHSPPGGDIVIEVEDTTEEVRFHVTDRGPGIPSEALGRIFEPFVRMDQQPGLGTGLGLPVSRRLAELLGGRVTVESKVGAGATFTLALPQGARER